MARTHGCVGWVSGAECRVFQTQMKMVRRVTHQTMDGVAPMVGYAAAGNANRSATSQAANPPYESSVRRRLPKHISQ